ncbi:hypothetical protein [Rhizobium rhizogenes]|uniref:hypothetical protein n=1 Tax=Rhizobium rhizogenes TaxID=359 RepID=UPI0022C395F2|nr:hypothetical protein [Rhizobium rhizogenes]MCZ7464833.1 hypothetical protein [Rhizobium rhizogenes]
MTADPFFTLTNNSEWNALIGRQGDATNYADGYIEAALDLANLIINEERIGQRDTLVLPILYNARHSIELHLKLVIGAMVDAGILSSGHAPNHDIASHFQYLNDYKIPDLAFRSLLTNLKPFIDSLAKIDDDGQELRYFTNRDGQRSLEDRALVNIGVIRDSLVTLKDTLELLKYRTIDFCKEFHTGTHTNCLSREDLLALARMLPKREEWSDLKFDECKTAIKKHFEIGNRQFSLALDMIQERRELNGIINVETPLIHLSDEKAIFLAEQWRVFHPPREKPESVAGYFNRNFEALFENRENEKDALDVILTELNFDEIADAETIFYLSRNREYSERYESNLDLKKKEYHASGDLQMEAFNLMHKTNFLSEFKRGVAMLGRLDLLDKLKDI